MAGYLIEFRFQGKARSEIRRLIRQVNASCRPVNAKRRPVPHITLVGPLKTSEEKRLIRDINDLCSKTKLMEFRVKGFSAFEHSNVVYLDIDPSEELDRFRWNLSQKLKPYCTLTPFDLSREFSFHSTVAMKLSPEEFRKVKSYVRTMEQPRFKHVLVRVTLLKNGKILREYDFLHRRMLTRPVAKSRNTYLKTMNLLKRYFEGTYDPDRGVKRSLWDRIKAVFGA